MKTTRDTLYDAFYQYLTDHTIPTPKGAVVSFLLLPKGEFRRRIAAREKGFKRINDKDIIKNIDQYRDSLPFVKQAKKNIKRLQKGEQKSIARATLRRNGGYITQLVFTIRDACDRYINANL